MSNTIDVPVVDITRIEQAVVRAQVPGLIDRLVADYSALIGVEVTTPEQREVVMQAEKACGEVERLAVSVCKQGRESAIMEQRSWINKERELVAAVKKIRDPLKKAKDDFDNIEQRRIDEAVRVWTEKVNARKELLFEIGFGFNGKKYVLTDRVGAEEFSWDMEEDGISGLGVNDRELEEWAAEIKAQLAVNRERRAEIEEKAEQDREQLEVLRRERQASSPVTPPLPVIKFHPPEPVSEKPAAAMTDAQYLAVMEEALLHTAARLMGHDYQSAIAKQGIPKVLEHLNDAATIIAGIRKDV